MTQRSDLPSLDIPFEYVQEELELLCRYREIKDQFLKLSSSGEMLACVQDNFQNSPAVMAAYDEAMILVQERLEEEKRRYPTWGFTLEKVMESHVPMLSEVLYNAISDYVRTLEAATIAEFAGLLVPETDFEGLKTLTQRFIKRGDLVKPYDLRRFNWHRVFPTKINGKDYQATLVVSPDSEMRMSFMLEGLHTGKKASDTVDLEPLHHQMSKEKVLEQLHHNLVEIGLGSVIAFLNQLQRQRQVMSGEAFPTIDVFSTALKLYAGVPLNEESYPDPIAAYALALEMNEMHSFNSGLNAMEYAACSPRMDTETLRELPNKPAEFVYHVIHGLLNLYKHILAEANDESGTLRVMGIGDKSTANGGETFEARSDCRESVEETLNA